jgi:hypothetical protein
MAKKSVGARRGRRLFLLALAVFVLVAAGVIQRRVFGIRQGHELKALQDQLQAAESRRVRLSSDIDAARSLGSLRPVLAGKLGMLGPEETRTVLLRRDAK